MRPGTCPSPGADMQSAFGVDHDISKMARPPRVAKPRFVPSPEQAAAAQARKAAQQAEATKARELKLNTPVGGGKKIPWKQHRIHSGKTLEMVLGGSALGSGSLYALNRRTEIKKASKETKQNVGLGAVGGTSLATAGYMAEEQAGKIALKNRRAARGISPREEQIWAEHKKKWPTQSSGPMFKPKRNEAGKVRGVSVRQNKWRSYANYPKGMHDWKLQRAAAITAHPAVATGVIGGGAALGAAYGLHRSKKAK